MSRRTTLTAQEAAEYIGISYWLILELVKRKQIPSIRAGARVLFRESALNDWMTNQEQASLAASKNDHKKLRAVK